MTAVSTRWMLVVVAASVVIGLGGVALTLTAEDPWAPLGDYPVQEVIGVTGDRVATAGIKCNDTDRAVQVEGWFGYQRVAPAGFTHEVGMGVGIRPPGCEELRWDNDIPLEVVAANEPGATWKINGADTPVGELTDRCAGLTVEEIRATGTDCFEDRSGETVAWETETFELAG